MKKMMNVTEKMECRACGEPFSGPVLLNFGVHAIVDFVKEGERGRGKAPLELVQCTSCGLVQLKHTVDANVLYKKFWYRSSINPQMRDALRDIVECAQVKVNLQPDDAVCDIGSNDGELLLNYPRIIHKVGFEPAEELAAESSGKFLGLRDEHFEIIPRYFNAIEALAANKSKLYKIVTAIAMFYDLDDPKDFLFDVKSILAEDGVFIVQMNYLGLMVRNLAFDNIGHEHLCYYSLAALKGLVDEVGLELFDVELNEVNGGSIRAYIGHRGRRDVDQTVNQLLLSESLQLSEVAIKSFASRVTSTTSILLHFLKCLKVAGKTVYAYGASTRGMTLLQCLFKNERVTDYLVAVAERDTKKFGKVMAGLNLPICSELEARHAADYMLVLPYHFWGSIREREKEWMSSGGRFIIPLPFPRVMKYSDHGPVGSVPLAHDLTEDLAGLVR
jgi:hypothetical protein